MALSLFPCVVGAAPKTWDGGGGTGAPDWSASINWANNSGPNINDEMVFPSVGGGVNKNTTNSFATGRDYDQIVFTASDYTIGNLGFDLTNSGVTQSLLLNYDSGTTTINVGIGLQTNNHLFQIGNGNKPTLDMNGPIDLNGLRLTIEVTGSMSADGIVSDSTVNPALVKTGAGTLTLNAANSYTGTTEVQDGTMVVNNTHASSSISVSSGANLNGGGTVNAVVCNGKISPGNGTTRADLGVNGSFTISGSAGGTASFQLSGTSAGVDYDQIDAAGTVTLSSSPILELTFGTGFTPTGGTEFILINKTSAGAISGNFSGVVEGTVRQVGTVLMRFSYVGGTGNDFTATVGADRIWDGGGAGNLWNTAANWVGDVAPKAGDNLIFPAGVPADSLATVNNFADNTVFGGIIFTGTGYSVSANSAGLNDITLPLDGLFDLSETAGINTFGVGISSNVPIFISCLGTGSLTVSGFIINNGHTLTLFSESAGTPVLTLSGQLSGAGKVVKDGLDGVRMSGSVSNTYGGGTEVLEGALHLQKNNIALPAGTISLGATSAASLVLEADNQIADGATVNLGALGQITGAFTDTINTLGLSAGSAVNMAGGSLKVSGAVNANGAGTSTWTGTLRGSSGVVSSVWTIGAGHLLSGAGIDESITKSGSGELRFATGPTLAGSSSIVTINEGSLQVTGLAPQTIVIVTGTGVFKGSGTVAEILGIGGSLQPGNPTGILTSSSSIGLNGACKLEIEIGGTTPGSGHDQLVTTFVSDTASINGCHLALTLSGGFVPSVGQQFRILDNLAGPADLVSGRFQGLEDGQRFSLGAALMEISYFGGTGNDVVLTCVELPAQPLRVWDGEAGNGLWSNPVNWLFDTPPQNGDDLEFSISSFSNLITTNDLAGASFHRITVKGGSNSPSVVFSGNSISLTNGLQSQAGFLGTVQWDIPLTLGGAVDIRNTGGTPLDVNGTINLGGNTLSIDSASTFNQLYLTVGGAISGAGNIRKISAGIARLDGATSNSFVGTTTIEAGSLALGKTDGAVAVPGPLVVGGSGTAASVSGIQPNQVGDGSQVSARAMGSVSLGTDTITALSMEGGSVSSVGLVVTGGIVAPVGTNSISGTLTFAGSTATPHSINVSGGALLNMQGLAQATSGHNIEKSGAGQLVLASLASSLSLAKVVAGNLQVDSNSPVMPVELAGASAVLGGNGSVGNVSSSASGGTLSPGASAGDLGTGNLTLTAAQTVVMEVGGTVPGSTHDQLLVTGSVELGGAALSCLPSGGFAPTSGQQFILIANDGVDPISGTFAGIPEGHEQVISGGLKFRFSYVGGDGNDFVASIPVVPPTGITRVWAGEFNVPDDFFWSTPANWVGGVAPQPGDSLLFPDTAPRHVAQNDFPVGTTFHQISITGNTGPGYTLRGNAIRLSGGVNYTRTGFPSSFQIPMTLEAPVTFTLSGDSGFEFNTSATINLNGFKLTISNSLVVGGGSSDSLLMFGVISGAAAVEHDGTGVLDLGSVLHSYSGQTLVKGGILFGRVPGSLTVGGGIGSAQYSTLGGGSNAIPDNATLSLLPGGTYQDGVAGFEKIGELVLAGGQITTVASTDRLDVSGGILVQGGVESLVFGNIGLAGPSNHVHSLQVEAGASVHFGRAVVSATSGTSLNKSGPGLAKFTGTNTLAGIKISEGIASFETVFGGGSSTGVPITLAGGTLRGNSSVGNVSAIAGGGAITPGLSPGILNVKNLALNPEASLDLDILGSTPGSGHDQLNVVGTADLAGASLSMTVLPGYLPSVGTPLVILQNDGADPVTGTFAGLPEGGEFAVGNITFSIGYAGGDGNDITLTPGLSPTGVTRVWSGLGANNLWATAENWVGDAIPALGDALEFPAGAFRRTNQNNFPIGTTFDSIRFSGNDEYSLGGSAVVLLGGISATSSAPTQHFINGMNMSLGEAVEFSCDANSVLNILNSAIALNGQDLILESNNPTGGPNLSSSPISGSGRVISRGTGRSRLFGPNTYPGDTLVESGTLDVGSFNGGGAPIRGSITVGAAGLPAVLLQTSNFALSSASSVTVGAQGQWNMQPGVLIESVATVNILGGTVSHGTAIMGVGSLSMVGGQINGSNQMTVSASLEAGGGGQAVISSPLTLSNNSGSGVEVRVEPDSSLLLSGAISGDANGTFLRKLGPGKAILSASGTTLPRMDIEAGTVQFDGQAPSTATFLKGGEISGLGRVGNVSSSASGGTANPGQNSGIINSPGMLSTGNVSWNANTTFRVGIGGAGPGISHDQITATGTIALGSAVLALDLSAGLSPTDGQSLTLINNDSTDPVTQTFTGLAEGAIIPATGGDFLISYFGGDGNDVVLVWNANAPPTPPALGNIVITPAGPASPAGFAATISGGPPNGTLLLKGSPDLQGPISTWETLATIPLDGSGSATVDITASPSSIGAPRYFFSLLLP